MSDALLLGAASGRLTVNTFDTRMGGPPENITLHGFISLAKQRSMDFDHLVWKPTVVIRDLFSNVFVRLSMTCQYRAVLVLLEHRDDSPRRPVSYLSLSNF